MTLVKNKETIMLKNVPNLIPPSSFLFSLQNFLFTLSIHSRIFWFHLLKISGEIGLFIEKKAQRDTAGKQMLSLLLSMCKRKTFFKLNQVSTN